MKAVAEWGGARRLGAAALAVVAVGSCSSPPPTGPDPNAPATVTVAPATALLLSLGDTVALTVTVRNASGQAISPALAWSSATTSIAEVDAQGRVVARGNGVATITATAGGTVSGAATVTVEQEVDSIATSGDAQGGEVGAPLDSTLVVTLLDARDNPIAGAPVTFTVAAGSGSVATVEATTDTQGAASTTWTLGTAAGLQELEVVAGFGGEASLLVTANAYALAAETLALFSGDGQSELVGLPLPEPLRVRVLDAHGNGVPDVPVSFSVDGDAALAAAEAVTDLDGVASVELTLGSALGGYTVTAEVPDSLTESGLPLAGSPITLTAEAVAYSLDPVGGLTVGEEVTLTGSGFHAVTDSNSVTIGGVAATILEGSQTELKIRVPSFGCTPLVARNVEVSRSGAAASQAVGVTPAGALSLEVGERVVLDDPDAFCVQLMPATGQEYLVGLTATRWFDATTTFAITGVDSIGPFPAPARVAAAARTASAAASVRLALTGEARLREAEARLFERLVRAPLASAPPSAAPPVEGDVLDLRLPDLRGDPCTDWVPVTAEVFSVGARLALATSATLPGPLDPAIVLLLDAANALHAAFGDTGVNLIMGLLGEPAGWDGDARVIVVLTPEVTQMGVPAYASGVDHLPRTTCPSSNEGRYVYVAVPDAATVAQLATTLAGSAPDLTHHIAHIVQWGRRLAAGGNFLPAWLAEGQAELAVEAIGMALSGLGAQQDLGASVLGLPGVPMWIDERFDRLALFNGWDGAAGTVAGAPEGCSLFGFGGPGSPCDTEAVPGAAWSFVRYVSDRFGPSFPGGEPALHRAVVDLESTGDVIALIEAMLGVTLPDLIVDWAATLYVDGRLTPAQAPDLQLASWKLLELLPAGPRRLAPATFGFADFQRTGSVVGGGTAYTLVGAAGAHGPLAISVGDGAGGALSEIMQPRVWVVRMR